MASTSRLFVIFVACLMSFMIAISSHEAEADPNDVELILLFDSVTIDVEDDSIIIPIQINNAGIEDVAAFQIWINISHPDLVHFVLDSSYMLWDPECPCSIEVGYPQYNITGTLVENWEWITARTLGSDGVIKVTAQAETDNNPPFIPPLGQIAGPIFNLILTTDNILEDPFMWQIDSTCIDSSGSTCIEWEYDSLALCDSTHIVAIINESQTFFSTPNGRVIGCDYVLDVDTFYFNCLEWEADSCVSWADTVIDSIDVCVVDPERVLLIDGKIELEGCPSACEWIVGDGDGNGSIDISDAVYLINFIFSGGPSPIPVPESADADCSGTADISDAVYLITYIFDGGPPPPCFCGDLL